ncbi:hypothetical protein [Fredinandcohnia sp. FSL W7-1320]|uniref:hypothetical protein n=1 Tax=Fredinandcohnia sp. FSL W7-1320 TaxID=2954540 RepID=UPI0030FDE14A
MAANPKPLFSLVLFGGSTREKIDKVDKITRLYPRKDSYELVVVYNKRNTSTSELTINNDHSIKLLGVNKGENSVNLISSKVLKICETNYFIFQNVAEDVYDIDQFTEIISKHGESSPDVVAQTTPVRRKDQYLIEDVPLLFVDKSLNNIMFARSILENSIEYPDQFSWKINCLLNSQFVSINPIKQNIINNDDDQDLATYFNSYSEQIKRVKNLLSKTKMNIYIRNAILKNLYEIIIGNQIGLTYKKIIKESNSNNQVNFLNQFYKWLKEIDIRILSFIPAIRYYFIRWTIDNYLSFSYAAKRQHLNVLKYIISNMHFDTHQTYIQKHNKMYPAALNAAKINSTIPIYLYLIKRKFKKIKG